MSPKPSAEVQIADHERRLTDVEEVLEGKDRTAGVLERLRTLEDTGLIATAKQAVIVAGVSLLVTAGPLLAVVLPEVQRLREAIEQRPTPPAPPAAPAAPVGRKP